MERAEIIELAAKLGGQIRDSEIYREFEKAEKLYRADNVLQAMISEYTVQQEALSVESAKDDGDEKVKAAIKARMDELYAAIMHNDVFEDFMSAESRLRELMDEVNRTIMNGVNGREDDDADEGFSGCTGNCAACGGCSK